MNDIQEHRSTKRKIFSNISSVMSAKIINILCGIVISIALARYLGSERQGILSYASSIVGMFSFLPTFGLTGILAREFSMNRDNSREFVSSAMLIMGCSSLLASILSFSMALYFNVSNTVLLFVFLYSLVNFAQICKVFETWFYSIAKMKLFSVAVIAMHLVFLAFKVLGIVLKADMLWFVLCVVSEEVFTNVLLLVCYKILKIPFIGKTSITRKTVVFLLKSCWPLVIMGAATTIYMRIDQLMIGRMIIDKRSLGVYSIGVALAEFWYFVPTIVYSSFFPSLSERYADKKAYYSLLQKFADGMVAIAYLAILGATMLGKLAIPFLYGKEYFDSSIILSIYVWAGLFICIAYADHATYLIENNTKIIMLNNLLCAVVNIILNYILIPFMGVFGAALATTLDYFIVRIFIMFFYWKKYREVYIIEIKALFPFFRLYNYAKSAIYSGFSRK